MIFISCGEAKGSVIGSSSLWDCPPATAGNHKLSDIFFVAIGHWHIVETVTVIHCHTTLFKLLSFILQSLRVIYSFLCSNINTPTSGMN